MITSARVNLNRIDKIIALVDRLDAGISKRPSRFDRKYHFRCQLSRRGVDTAIIGG